MTPEERRIYDRNWYKNNKNRRQELNDKWEKKQQETFLKLKSILKCNNCIENDPVCLEFHHLNPIEKEGNISILARKYSFKRLQKEIDKCIVLCANCHRKEHSRLKLFIKPL